MAVLFSTMFGNSIIHMKKPIPVSQYIIAQQVIGMVAFEYVHIDMGETLMLWKSKDTGLPHCPLLSVLFIIKMVILPPTNISLFIFCVAESFGFIISIIKSNLGWKHLPEPMLYIVSSQLTQENHECALFKSHRCIPG